MIKETKKVSVEHFLSSEAAEVSWADNEDGVGFEFLVEVDKNERMSPEAAWELGTMLRKAARAKGYKREGSIAEGATVESENISPVPVPVPAPVLHPGSPQSPPGPQDGAARETAPIVTRPPRQADGRERGASGGSDASRNEAAAPSGTSRDFDAEAIALKTRITAVKAPTEVKAAHVALHKFASDEVVPEELRIECVRLFNMTHPSFR